MKERSKIEETIYIFFDGYPKEDVDGVIKDLNEYDKNILFLRYGKDLEHPVRSENWTEEHRNYFFNELIPRMKIKLETLHITPVKVKHVFKKPVPMDEQKNRIKSPKKEEKPNKGTSLYAMYPEIKKEDLKLIVYHLDSTKKRALYLRHSETLNSYKYLSLIDFRKIEAKYNEAIVLLDKIALEYKKTLKEQIQFDEKNLELLNQDEKKALEIIHGENHDKTLPTFVLNKTEKELYAKALKLLKNGLQQVKSPKEEIITDKHLKKELPKKTCQSVEEVQEKSCEKIKSPSKVSSKKSKKETKLIQNKFPDKTLEEIREAVKKLTKKQQEAIYARHGQDLDTYNEWSKEETKKYRGNYCNSIKILNSILYENKQTKEETKLIQDKFPDKTLEEIKEAVKKLAEKRQEAIYARHGKELDTYNKWNKEETKKYVFNYHYAIKNLNFILYENKQTKEETKLIQDKFPDKTLEEIKEAVKKLTKKQQEAIYVRYGEDLSAYNKWDKKERKKYALNYHYAIKNLNSMLYKNKQAKLIQNKFPDKTLEEIKEAVKKLAKKQQEAIYARHGKELDTYNKWNKEEAKKYTFNYHYAIKNLNSILYEKNQTLDIKVIPEIETRLNSAKPKKEKENSIKDASKKTYQYITEVPKSKNEVKQEENTSVIFEGKSEWINLSINDSGELIHFNINYNGILTKENKRTLEIMIETALKEALHKMKFSLERIKPNGLQEKFLDKATGEIKEEVEKSEKLLHSDQNEYVKASKVPTVSKKKLNTKKKEQPISVSKKDPLKEEKQKLKVRLYDKYFPVYKDFITPKEMEIIIDESVNSYQIEENINMETSSVFKIESAIYMLLSKKYCENIDNEIGLNISLFVEEFYGSTIKNRYANFSQGDISEALLKTLETYDGEKTFFIETILYLKKKSN